ncbi:hypothetical protein BDV33DRAFT_77268 [Aspergillus novoparasiticus]|uniref:Uncharacterized protein n=1 Tax=Aspergillus novoparasiticus TaxID=986946 RepID=A0A5N6E8P6_9EURO|nr:hypothetical protein BDV33DRAFT_77268 [Aspergillus novoparasiticus]
MNWELEPIPAICAGTTLDFEDRSTWLNTHSKTPDTEVSLQVAYEPVDARVKATTPGYTFTAHTATKITAVKDFVFHDKYRDTLALENALLDGVKRAKASMETRKESFFEDIIQYRLDSLDYVENFIQRHWNTHRYVFARDLTDADLTEFDFWIRLDADDNARRAYVTDPTQFPSGWYLCKRCNTKHAQGYLKLDKGLPQTLHEKQMVILQSSEDILAASIKKTISQCGALDKAKRQAGEKKRIVSIPEARAMTTVTL